MKKNFLMLLFVLSLFSSCLSDNLTNRTKIDGPALIPQPVSLEYKNDVFVMDENTVVVMPENEIIIEAVKRLRKSSGFPLRQVDAAEANVVIFKEIEADDSMVKGYYTLDIDRNKVLIQAAEEAGLFYGLQTMLQLTDADIYVGSKAKSLNFYAVSVEDYPKYQWRGLHFDEGRHFKGLESAKKFIDLMVMHKLNIFHWHLTEDQGWRIEIKSFPKLTEVGSVRDKTLFGHHFQGSSRRYLMQEHKGFYTQEEAKELIEYARLRCIDVLPEIEMPGHAQAAIKAYPELGIDPNEQLDIWPAWGISDNIFSPRAETIEAMKQILGEVIDLFPFKFVHIGGDEALKNKWKTSAEVQEIIANTEGVNNEDELQSWFIKQVADYVESRGRKIIGWDEILEGGLAENATVTNWRQPRFGRAVLAGGNDLIAALNSHVYFDYYQTLNRKIEPLAIGGYISLKKIYSWDVFPDENHPEHYGKVLGGQGQLWSEYLPLPVAVEYMAFPRFSALAEVVWGTSNPKKFADFESRLYAHLDRLDAYDVSYRFPFDEKKQGRVAIAGDTNDTISLEYKMKADNAKRLQLYFAKDKGNAEFWINSVELYSGDTLVTGVEREGFVGDFQRLNFYTFNIAPEFRNKELTVKVKGYMYTGGSIDLALYSKKR